MFNEDHEITDPTIIRNLVNNATNLLPHLPMGFRPIDGVSLASARDTYLEDMSALPNEGDSVKGYRFYRISEDGEKRSGIFNNYVPADNCEEDEEGLHFWFNKSYAKAYMLSSIKNDITNHQTADTYVLEEVTGIYKGVSQDEGFTMSLIEPNRTTVLRVDKSDIAQITS